MRWDSGNDCSYTRDVLPSSPSKSRDDPKQVMLLLVGRGVCINMYDWETKENRKVNG